MSDNDTPQNGENSTDSNMISSDAPVFPSNTRGETVPNSEPSTDDDSTGGGDSDLQQTFDRSYVVELREQNARYRRERNELREQLEAMQGQGAGDEPATGQDQQQQPTADPSADVAARLAQLENQLADERARRETAEMAALRARVGGELGIPAAVADRLRGATEEELRADAQTLLGAIGGGGAGNGRTTSATPGGPPVRENAGERIQRRRNRNVLWD